jgi:hypothetical protein
MSAMIDISEYRKQALKEIRDTNDDIKQALLLIHERNGIIGEFVRNCKKTLDNWQPSSKRNA